MLHDEFSGVVAVCLPILFVEGGVPNKLKDYI